MGVLQGAKEMKKCRIKPKVKPNPKVPKAASMVLDTTHIKQRCDYETTQIYIDYSFITRYVGNLISLIILRLQIIVVCLSVREVSGNRLDLETQMLYLWLLSVRR